MAKKKVYKRKNTVIKSDGKIDKVALDIIDVLGKCGFKSGIYIAPKK